MFYSHEILTERLYGVGTVWLVATVGTSSIHSKVTRKEIMAVNLPMACKTVMSPAVPLALRLQSNLLYGISKVYDQQCNYFLSDVNLAYTSLIRMVTSRGSGPNHLTMTVTTKSRPEGLVLSNDPAFILNLDQVPFPIEEEYAEDVEEGSTVICSLPPGLALGGRSSQTLFSPVSSALQTPGPREPSSSSVQADLGFKFPDEEVPEVPEELFLENPGFSFGPDGEFLETNSPQLPRPPLDHTPSVRLEVRTGNAQGRSSRLNSEDFAGIAGLEHEEGRERTMEGDQRESQYAPPEFVIPSGQLDSQPRGSPSLNIQERSSEQGAENDSHIAPIRRVRKRGLINDREIELEATDIRAWRDNYLENMDTAIKKAQAKQVTRNAKANANNIIFGIGFFGELRNPVLKSLFSVQAVLGSLKGVAEEGDAGEKRKWSPEAEEQDGEGGEGRRVRARTTLDAEELGRGLVNLDESEIGRQAPDIRSDGYRPSSQASIHWNKPELPAGSRLHSAGGFPSSSIGGDFLDMGSRRGSHQSSPLGGRGLGAGGRMSVLRSPIGEGDEDTIMPGTDMVEGFGEAAEEFEFFGPGANIDTQGAKDSQWFAEALERECYNFFGFVKDEIAKRQEADQNVNSVAFEELIPLSDSRIVAAQAFSHTLLLATRDLLRVSQGGLFGAIQISLV